MSNRPDIAFNARVIINHVKLLPYIKLLTLSNVRLFKPDELGSLHIIYRSCNQHSQFIQR